MTSKRICHWSGQSLVESKLPRHIVCGSQLPFPATADSTRKFDLPMPTLEPGEYSKLLIFFLEINNQLHQTVLMLEETVTTDEAPADESQRNSERRRAL